MDIIEIAKECDAFKHEYRPTVICFYADDFIKFTQRIEQPLQHRINELIFDVAHQQRQIEQLREALQELLYAHTDKAVDMARKALGETK